MVGGYAVVYHGFTRATGDLDVWVGTAPLNAERLVAALQEFGFGVPELSADLFVRAGSVVRMGVPPLRIEMLTTAHRPRFRRLLRGTSPRGSR